MRDNGNNAELQSNDKYKSQTSKAAEENLRNAARGMKTLRQAEGTVVIRTFSEAL